MMPVIWTMAGAILAVAETVRRQVYAGERVGFLLRLLFAAGIWSILLWTIVFLMVGFPVAIWVGNMTWTRPPG
jgi:hypothetical protein